MADSPAAEHDLGEDEVRALLRIAAPDLAALPLTKLAEGWDNVIWRLGPALAVRIPRRAIAAPLITNEQRALAVIGPRLAEIGIRSPIPVVAGAPTPAFPWPWSVVPWIDGGRALDCPRAENDRWSARLAAAIMAIHRESSTDAPANPFRGGALDTRAAVMQERLALHPQATSLRETWDAGLAAAQSQERVWIHGDLHPGNVIVADGDLAGVIDFGDVTAGDPAYDLAVHWLLFTRAGRDAFRTATANRYDDATWTRARAWAAYLALLLLTQSDDRPDYRSVGAATAAELS